MALDLGLARRPKPVTEKPQAQEAIATADVGQLGREDASYHISRAREAIAKKRTSDSSSAEGRRALLACYTFCAR